MDTTEITPNRKPTAIDMCTPQQALAHLGLTEQGLLGMVNSGHLAAYNLGSRIRFKVIDVLRASALLAAA